MPSPRFLHEGVMDILRAGDGYRLAYAAAFRYPAEVALSQLAVPSAIVVRGADVIGSHLDRLPPLAPGCAVERLPADRDGFASGLLRHLEPVLAWDAAPPPPEAAEVPGRITRTYVSTSYGQLLLRRAGEGGARPLLLVHGSPGGALPLEPLLATLAPSRRVLAFDTLGNGDSDKPPWQVAEIGRYAGVLAEALDGIGVGELDLYGTHTGAHIAIELALSLGPRVRGLVLDGVALLSDEERDDVLANYFVSLEPRWDGTHLYSAWQLLRDSCLWWPWYRRDPAAALAYPFYEDPDELHALVVELLRSGETYPIAYRAAFAYPTRERLRLLRERERVLLCTHPADPLHPYTPEAAELAGASAVVLPESVAGVAAIVQGFLDQGGL
jgi:pimeloyl-ACP methyl ester carboxylesterase